MVNVCIQPAEPTDPLPSTTMRLPSQCSGLCFEAALRYLYDGVLEPAETIAVPTAPHCCSLHLCKQIQSASPGQVPLLWCAAALQIDDLQAAVVRAQLGCVRT